jgi:hypothetical protein
LSFLAGVLLDLIFSYASLSTPDSKESE